MDDVIIIGSGPAGMTAGLYLARANLKVAIIERGLYGGQMQNTFEIENYPGVGLISGQDLSDKMYEPLEQFGVDNLYGDVQSIEDHIGYKTIVTDDGNYTAKSVIIASGSQPNKLNVTGEDEYSGRGVSYCAICDGSFFRDKKVYVVGGGDSAVEEALYLTQFASEVIIVHRRNELRAQKYLQDKAYNNPKISFIYDHVVNSIKGNGKEVTNLELKNVHTGDLSLVDADGVFIYVGLTPNTEFVPNSLKDAFGYIVTDESMKTVQPGIFAIGDVRQKTMRQIATAVGDGAQVSQSVYHYLENLD